MSLKSFSVLHPRALPIPPLSVTSLPLSLPPFPSSPFSLVTSHRPWPRAFLSPARGLVPPLLPSVYPCPLLRLPYFRPLMFPSLLTRSLTCSLYIMLPAGWTISWLEKPFPLEWGGPSSHPLPVSILALSPPNVGSARLTASYLGAAH